MQYVGLNALQATYARDITILAFPCNQFGLQEPGQNNEILNGVEYVRPGEGYRPNFPLFAKIDVNGPNEVSLYTHLKDACPATSKEIGDSTMLFWNPININDITWNFEKFLIDRNGFPRYRFHPSTEPEEIEHHIRFFIK